MTRIICVRDYPSLASAAAKWFSEKWTADYKVYNDSIAESAVTDASLPRWYLMLRGGKIIGGYGLVDFKMEKKPDMRPWLCALYIEPEERGAELGAKLLAHAERESARSGFSSIYLSTEHIGYYEKYGWNFLGSFKNKAGKLLRVYVNNLSGA